MAIKTGSTWKEIKTVMCPAVNGVRKEAQAVRIHNGTTWVDVWSNIKIMTVLSNNITKGWGAVSEDTRTIGLFKFMDSGVGSISGGGTIVLYLDGEWVNPTITFDYSGGFSYFAGGNWIMIAAGGVSIYHRVKGATAAGTTVAKERIGQTQTDANGVDEEVGTYTGTLTGTYDRLGLSITLNSFSGSYSNALMTLNVSNPVFGSQKIGFPASLAYNYQD